MTPKLIASVGGSIGRAWSGALTEGSAMVLETVALTSPAMATMSPASALSTGTRSSPRKAKILVARPSSTSLPSTSSALIGMFIVEPAAFDPAGEDAAEERVAVEQGGEHPERAGVDARRGDVADDGLEQRRQIARADVVGGPGVTGAAAGVERREVELLVIGVEVEEQLEHLVEHFGGARVGAVDLVDHDDRLEAERERLAGDELGLRHRAFGGVDQQDHAVDHRQDALDLGAEIGVAGGVDDVDVRGRAVMRPFDAGALGEDGDPALFLEVGRIHRPLLDALVVAEGARLAEQLVDERRLAVVDVGDDRHVAQIHLRFSRKISSRAM